ncbi:MAG TPA: hypothetical protein DCR43_00055 [Bacteroidales bacterium]|nr:MAG: hypothetical protein A2X11_04630 [Bacteroidetes bacterium GWE2_42_24]OFY27694.1 MAG: hypothetical protein A2X09_10870 [Bacteroidetes bacterium GWF2_43_11]HAQ64245.1 hypothetical protein [Bacteroidales bacterium]HBZ66544.1 hypothetical protein [Bacteroidales bacterium]
MIDRKYTFQNVNNSSYRYSLFKGNLFPEKYIGDNEAEVEWNADSTNSSKVFVHTQSYKVFQKESMLFLWGRRGTGKTAIIRMLDYEIKQKKNKLYLFSTVIRPEKFFYDLTTIYRDPMFSNFYKEELSISFVKIWQWVIISSALVEVDRNYSLPDADIPDQIKTVKKYLAKHKLGHSSGLFFNGTGVYNALLEQLKGEFKRIQRTNQSPAFFVSNVLSRLTSDDFRTATEALCSFLHISKSKILVMIDSNELYNLKDEVSAALVSSLMKEILDFYEKKSSGIIVKAAFPSEMYPYFPMENIGKINDKIHFIHWRFKDIVNLIAKRYYNLLIEKDYRLNGLFNLNDFENFTKSKEFLEQYFPETVITFSGIKFPTFPFIIRHTQKKPRQIITILNTILSLANENDISFTCITKECITEGSNIRLKELTDEAFSIYDSIYNDATSLIKKAFTDMKNLIKIKDVHERLSKCKSHLTSFDRDDAIRLFFECGLIGIVMKEEQYFTTKHIIQSLFEYQVKDILVEQFDHLYAIHPMFYQPLNIQVDMESLVYPMPVAEEFEEDGLLCLYKDTNSNG